MKKPANRKPVRPVQPEGRFSYQVNGHTLHGEKFAGARWLFACPDWPELAAAHNGAESSAAILAEFMARALAGAVTFGPGAGK